MQTFLSAAAAAAGSLAITSGAALAHGYTIGDLKIGHPWSLPVPAGAAAAAGYLTLTNLGTVPERLLGAETPEADRVEIHQMTMDGAIMRMRPVEGGLVVPPGQTVTLAPGGYHLMMIKPKRAFAVGDHILGALRLARAGTVPVDFHVQAAPPQHKEAQPPADRR